MRFALTALAIAALTAPLGAQVAKKQTSVAKRPAAVATGMTNADVAKMVKAGLGEDVIVTSIQTAAKKGFDLSPSGLVDLKIAGVPDRVILAMQGKDVVALAAVAARDIPVPSAAKPVPPPAVKAVTLDDSFESREAGIYTVSKDAAELIESTTVTAAGVGAGSMLASGFSMGLKKVKVKAELPGVQAATRLSDAPVFLFHGSGFNPSDYLLVIFQTTGTQRQIIIGQAGMLGVKNGIRPEDQVSVRVTKVKAGLYRVAPSRNLPPGEYAFVKIADDKDRHAWAFGVDR